MNTDSAKCAEQPETSKISIANNGKTSSIYCSWFIDSANIWADDKLLGCRLGTSNKVLLRGLYGDGVPATELFV